MSNASGRMKRLSNSDQEASDSQNISEESVISNQICSPHLRNPAISLNLTLSSTYGTAGDDQRHVAPRPVESAVSKATILPDQATRIFPCNFCQRKFQSSQALGGHQNAHKRERNMTKTTQRTAMSPPMRDYHFTVALDQANNFNAKHLVFPQSLHALPTTFNSHLEAQRDPIFLFDEKCQFADVGRGPGFVDHATVRQQNILGKRIRKDCIFRTDDHQIQSGDRRPPLDLSLRL